MSEMSELSKPISVSPMRFGPTLLKHLTVSLLLVLQIVISIYWLWTHPSGDEAIHMYNAYRVSQGERPYLDFFSYITPGTYLLGGGVLSLVSGKIVYLRVFMLILALWEILLMSRVLANLVGQGLAHSLWLVTYVSVTALSATYFSHHNIDHFIFVLMLYLLVTHQENISCFAWLGVAVAADSFVHQSHGFYYFAVVSVYLMTLSREDRTARLRYLGAFVTPILILYGFFVVWLISTGSLKSFLDDAILWILSVYGKHLAFGIYEDTLFYISNNINLVEQGFFLLAKLGVQAACGFIVLSILVPKWRSSVQGNHLLVSLLLLATGIGSLQTLHNPAAYYVFFFMAVGVYLLSNRPTWVLTVLLICTCIQVIRVGSFPLRHAQEYDFSKRQLVKVQENYLVKTPDVVALIELSEHLKRNGIKNAVVVGRSPEIYLLTGIRNPTRHDIVLPVYLTDAQLGAIKAQVKTGVVIYDKTLEKLEEAKDFFDVHHYKKSPDKLKEMSQADLFRGMKQKPILFQTSAYEVYGVEKSPLGL